MGISRSHAYGLLADPGGSREAARKRRYAGICRDCGGSYKVGGYAELPGLRAEAQS
jgi:hypothetical protein